MQHAFWHEGSDPEFYQRRVFGIDAVVAGAKVAHARGDVVVLIDGEGVKTGGYGGTQNRQENYRKHKERDIGTSRRGGHAIGSNPWGVVNFGRLVQPCHLPLGVRR